MRIVAFGHQSGVGKDTCANLVYQLLYDRGINCQRFSFAHKLKQQCHELYSWAGLKPPEYYETRREERTRVLPDVGLTPLQIWIRHGEATRSVYPYIYPVNVLKEAERAGQGVAIISDLRNHQEVRVMPDDAVLIKVVRPGAPKLSEGIDHLLDGYDWPHIIHNDGTVRDLVEPLLEIMRIERILQ